MPAASRLRPNRPFRPARRHATSAGRSGRGKRGRRSSGGSGKEREALNALHNLLIFVVGFVASAINAIAFGGSLVSFPTLIWLGLPAITANATNTAAVWPGSLGAV